MADLRTFKKHELFLTLKRNLVMAIQTTHIIEKWVDDTYKQMKEEEGRRIAVVDAFTLAKQRIKDLNVKLNEANRDRKSAKIALAGAERQEEDQRQQLRKVEDYLTIAKEQIDALKKKLEKAEDTIAQAEQEGYDTRVKKTKENLRAQVTGVCRSYCLQVWNEALNQAWVDAFFISRRAENAFYPLALCVAGSFSSRTNIAPKAPEPSKTTSTNAVLAPTVPSKVVDRASAVEKDKEPTMETALKPAKLPPVPKDSSNEKGASQGQVLVLATLPFTTKEDPKGKGAAQAIVPEVPAQTAAKANPPPFKTT